MTILRLSFLCACIAAITACGSTTSNSGGGGGGEGDGVTSTSVIIQQADAELAISGLKVLAPNGCQEDRGDFTNDTCLVPQNYTVGTKTIEFVACGDEACTDESSSDDVTASTLLYESDETTGLAANLTDGVTIPEADLEELDAGTYSGIRFTIAYLQQTLDPDDLNVDGIDTMTYRICTMDGGCPDAAASEAGDIMVDHDEDGEFNWVDDDAGEEATLADMLVDSRPDNPATLQGFDCLGEENCPDGDPTTGFTAIVQNSSLEDEEETADITIEADTDYTITTTFTVGGAFRFEDLDDNDTLDFENDGQAEPGKPDSITFTAVEAVAAE